MMWVAFGAGVLVGIGVTWLAMSIIAVGATSGTRDDQDAGR